MGERRAHLIHATTVAVPIDGDWVGVLLRGPSGSGKSDLALRLIDHGACLVADDQCELCADGATVIVQAPARVAGTLEVRGIGLVPVENLACAPLGLVVDLVDGAAVERLPAPRWDVLANVRVPAIRLAPFEASACAKIRLAARAAVAGTLWACDRLAAS